MVFIIDDAVIRGIHEVLDGHKALDIEVLDVGKKTNITKYFILATANSVSHLKLLSDEVILYLKNVSKKKINMGNLTGKHGSWVAVDGGDVIIHLFKDETRKYYDLESLWKVTSDSN